MIKEVNVMSFKPSLSRPGNIQGMTQFLRPQATTPVEMMTDGSGDSHEEVKKMFARPAQTINKTNLIRLRQSTELRG